MSVRNEINDHENTILDYYHGAYGHTVRIDVQSKEWLNVFKTEIIKLINNTISEIGVHKMKNVIILTSFELRLFKIDDNQEPTVIEKNENNKKVVNWIQNKSQLNKIVGLIDGLLASDNPGHQYLVEEDIIIELAYLE